MDSDLFDPMFSCVLKTVDELYVEEDYAMLFYSKGKISNNSCTQLSIKKKKERMAQELYIELFFYITKGLCV